MIISPESNLTQGLVGGVLIGGSASLLMLKEQQIMGASGIITTALEPFKKTKNGVDASGLWTWSFLAGLISSGACFAYLKPEVFGGNETTGAMLSPLGAALAGILTGFGTKLGSGCTSGHGICGLPRRSPRSLTAVCTFMFSGGLTVYCMRVYKNTAILAPLLSSDGCASITKGVLAADNLYDAFRPLLFVGCGAFISHRLLSSKSRVEQLQTDAQSALSKTSNSNTIIKEPTISTHLVTFSCGSIFGLGLGIGGMLNSSKVSGFLDIFGTWDYTLVGVMGGGVLVTSIAFEWMRRNGMWPKQGMTFHPHPDTWNINWKLIFGSALFGMGWGLSGVCPGPATTTLPGALIKGVGNSAMAIFMPFMFAGMALQRFFS